MATITSVMPHDRTARLIGRVGVRGEAPIPVFVFGTEVYDLRGLAPTVSALLEREDLGEILDDVSSLVHLCGVGDLGSVEGGHSDFVLLAPIDLQVVKACGVTFVESMLERLVEERSRGDARKAADFRADIASGSIGGETLTLSDIKPGSVEALDIRDRLVERGMWSQYLEVGLGPDPEVFTKAPVLSSVGTLSSVGIPKKSDWSNPEPELVLVVNSRGEVLGATLGNDVNLRDVEGRSALLLGSAKDNNRSSAVGPFIRLFGGTFTIDSARQMEIQLTVEGRDGFELYGANAVTRISRPFEELVRATWGDHHQYPDGFVLFTGTLFAPTQDRGIPGEGFTHHMGDIVTIESAELGKLINTVGRSEELGRWTYGIGDLLRDLTQRYRHSDV